MNRIRSIIGWAIAVATLSLVVMGCGESGGDKTVTVERPAAEAPPPEEDPAEPSEQPVKKKKKKSAVASDPGGGSITVPDVEGKDHQLAQDTMQAAGLYILNEKDCSGQNRVLLVDRNWTVQSQEPAGGSKVSEDQEITLCSVKDGE
jgi:PASTA domain